MFNYILSCTFARLHRQISIFARPDSKSNRNSKSKAYFALSFQMGKVSSLPVLFLYFHFGMVSGFFLFAFFLVLKKKRVLRKSFANTGRLHMKTSSQLKLPYLQPTPSGSMMEDFDSNQIHWSGQGWCDPGRVLWLWVERWGVSDVWCPCKMTIT